jgi:hypothetical protein
LHQNPIALALHSTRWFNACPGNIFVQYGLRSERNDTIRRSYPFSYQNPFLYNFDWVVGPSNAAARRWQNLGSLVNKKEAQGIVGLFVQRLVPHIIYSVKGPPYLTFLSETLLPMLSSNRMLLNDSTIVVYVGGGGVDGPPDRAVINSISSSPVVAAVFAENLDTPYSQRPPNVFNAPIGMWYRI